jgi:hypothetical protein
MLESGWILGLNGFFDIHFSENDNTHHQAGVGVEALSEDWDLRLNGYIPTGDKQRTTDLPLYEIYSTKIQVTKVHEHPLYGVDGEIGYRLPVTPPDSETEFRVYAGAFYFDNDDLDFHSPEIGPSFRAEARLYDLDFIGAQSRLTVGTQVTYDDTNGARAYGSLVLRVPFQVFAEAPEPPLTGLNRRMTDPIWRDFDVRTSEVTGSATALNIDNMSVPVEDIFFARSDIVSANVGSPEAPTTLADALAQASSKPAAIVVLDGSGGAFDTTGLVLPANVALLGGGAPIPESDEFSPIRTGAAADVFVPPGSRPTLNGTNAANDLVTIANNTVVNGLDFTGSFNNGIGGTVANANFSIRDLSIAAPGGDGLNLSITSGGVQGTGVIDSSEATSNGMTGAFTVNSSDGTERYDVYLFDTFLSNTLIGGPTQVHQSF